MITALVERYFNTAKIQAILDFTIRPWQDALAEFCGQLRLEAER